jgi:hypothetical protein
VLQTSQAEAGNLRLGTADGAAVTLLH